MPKSRASSSPVRKPQQDRSRASFDRVLDAAIALITKLGYDNVTLADVSRKAKTSIGSIYCRVDSKEDLMRAVQGRVFEAMTIDADAVLDPVKWARIDDLGGKTRFLIRETAELLRRHAPLLRALSVSKPYDRVVTTAGREWHLHLAESFEKILMRSRMQIQHPHPDFAVSFCFDVTYAALTKYLGIGIIPDYVTLDNWARLVDELGSVFSLYLLEGAQHPRGTNSAQRKGAGRPDHRQHVAILRHRK